ncbi:MAG: hypothetical protein ACF8NJ_05995 [Phycisphaerales bacterium JB038]
MDLHLILVSCIPGAQIRDWAEDAIARAGILKKPLRVLRDPYSLENALLRFAKVPPPASQAARASQVTLGDLLAIPPEDLVPLVHGCLSAVLEQMLRDAIDSGRSLGILTFHPVLLHQITSEFFSPYRIAEMRNAINSARVEDDDGSANIRLSALCSIHDDIYDCYRQHLAPSKLFAPELKRRKGNKVHRLPLQDIHELCLIADWRDRELMCARSIAAGLGCKHWLFHRKGLIDAFWEATTSGRLVYFSHPISAPRRDMHGPPDPEKNKSPDPKRGLEFMTDCQQLANALGSVVPLSEPTCIDEYRFDRQRPLQNEDLSDCILPPLTRRWPIGEGHRVSNIGSCRTEEDLHLLPVSDSVFAGAVAASIQDLEVHGASAVLGSEVARQISVRDHFLAEQASLIVAYRPFANPDSADPTGGVDEEIAVMQRKLSSGVRLPFPCVIILHSPEDESRRRRNALKTIWPSLRDQYLSVASDSQAIELLSACTASFTDVELRELQIADRIRAKLLELGVTPTPTKKRSTLGSQAIQMIEAATRQFLEYLLPSVLRPDLFVEAEASQGAILIVRSGSWREVVNLVSDVWELEGASDDESKQQLERNIQAKATALGRWV